MMMNLVLGNKAAMPRFGNKVPIDGEARTLVLALGPECIKDGDNHITARGPPTSRSKWAVGMWIARSCVRSSQELSFFSRT